MLRTKTVLLVILLALVVAACGTAETTFEKTTPTGLTATAAGASVINLSWNAPTDNVGVAGYRVERCQGAGCSTFAQVAAPTGTSFSDTGLAAATSYSYRVRATDTAGNLSPYSIVANATTAGTVGDTTPPSAPTNLTATAAGASQINLSWSPSTDNVGVTGYVVRRNGTPVATPVTTSYADTGLTAGTTYRYTVAALDAAGNNSPLSTYARATTTGTPPTPPPPIPSTLGWFQIPNTKLRTACPSPATYPEIQGFEGCSAVVEDWSGGTLDSARNRLLIWGGGHGGYAGNEVYALSLNTLTMDRLNNPSTPVTLVPADCSTFTNPTLYADGKPVSRHTYNHLAYLPNLDAMFAWGGSMFPCGHFAGDTWLFSLSGLSWTQKSSINGPSVNYGRAVAHDPNTGLVYARDDFEFYSYNPATDSWTKRSSTSLGMNDVAGVIDPVRKRYILHRAGSSTLYWYDISSPTASVPILSGPTSGCSGFVGDPRVGMEYDPIQDRIVGWDGGNTAYILNPDNLSCTAVSYIGGPASVANGTWGRFRYVPSLNLFAVCNSVDENCYTLRLTD